MNLKFLCLLLSLLMLSACASSAKRREAFTASIPSDIPKTFEIANVPFIEQEKNHCGPASLAMVLNSKGRSISSDQIASSVLTPGMKGSFQTDMLSTARRQGFMSLEIKGLSTLVNEISHGNPVIVFENLGLSWTPQYHYAVVYGYDLDRQELKMHSGPDQAKIESFKVFENSWHLTEYWGMVVLKPGELSPSASEVSHLNSASALEQLGYLKEAELAYQSILKRWPQSLGALVGLGNISYAKKDYPSSIRYLQKAVAAHPDSVQAKHNLKIAQSSLRP